MEIVNYSPGCISSLILLVIIPLHLPLAKHVSAQLETIVFSLKPRCTHVTKFSKRGIEWQLYIQFLGYLSYI